MQIEGIYDHLELVPESDGDDKWTVGSAARRAKGAAEQSKRDEVIEAVVKENNEDEENNNYPKVTVRMVTRCWNEYRHLMETFQKKV